VRIGGTQCAVEGVSPRGVRRLAMPYFGEVGLRSAIRAPTSPKQGPRGARKTVLLQFTWRSESFQNDSRSLNFWILPVAVRASSSRNSIRLGIL
jgi:hypothetical protein